MSSVDFLLARIDITVLRYEETYVLVNLSSSDVMALVRVYWKSLEPEAYTEAPDPFSPLCAKSIPSDWRAGRAILNGITLHQIQSWMKQQGNGLPVCDEVMAVIQFIRRFDLYRASVH